MTTVKKDSSYRLLRAIQENDQDKFNKELETLPAKEINKLQRQPADWTTYLLAAIDVENVEFVKKLLERGADVNDFRAEIQFAPIHLSIRKKNPEILNLLLMKGADVNILDGDYKTALYILLSRFKKEEDNEKCLYLSSFITTNINNSNTEIMNQFGQGENIQKFWLCLVLLLNHPDVDVHADDLNDVTPVKLAISKRLYHAAGWLFVKGAHVDRQFIAKESEKIKRNQDPNALSDWGDFLGKYSDKVRENELPPPDDENTNLVQLEKELHKALRNKNSVRFQKLFDLFLSSWRRANGRNVNGLQEYKFVRYGTFLQAACKEENINAVELLKKAEVDPNATSYHMLFADPPLIIAAKKGNEEILKLLKIIPGIDLNIVNGIKETALHKIAKNIRSAETAEDRSRFIRCLQILLPLNPVNGDAVLKTPIDINAQDEFGNTALHYVALSGAEDQVLRLIRYGAQRDTNKNKVKEASLFQRILAFKLSSLHKPGKSFLPCSKCIIL